jgi:caffeoyl-CoA O-methyltransferase
VTPKSEFMPPALQDYMIDFGAPPDAIQRELIAETAVLFPDNAGLQIAPEQGGFLTLMTRLIGAKSAIELGTFTGYSALAIARGLPEDGQLICCDISDKWTSVGRRYWERAGVADRIDLRIAPALETLRALPAEPTIDLVFLDADKPAYIDYWEELVPRVRPGGLLLVDNVFSHLGVLDENPSTENARAIKAFNAHVFADARIEQVMIPLADGVTIARKLP